MARVHHRLAWILGATLVGAAACGGGGGETKGGTGTPGGTAQPPGEPGKTPTACVGKEWFGEINEGSRTKVVDLLCADARAGSIMPGRLSGDAGPSCKGAYTVRSDDEIAGILSALDKGQAKQANLGEPNATSSQVRDFAHVDAVTHSRAGEEQRTMLRRTKARAEDAGVSRAIAKGFEDADKSLQNAKGPSFDRELMSRVIIQHARALEMLDELSPQAKSEDTRCSVEKARDVMAAHLSLACVVWSGLPAAPARPTRQQAQLSGPAQHESPATQSPATQSQSPATQSQSPATQSQSPATETQAPATQSQSPATETQAPATETQEPANESPAHEAPVTQAPVTQSPVTQSPVTQAPAPEQDPPSDNPAPANVDPCEPCP